MAKNLNLKETAAEIADQARDKAESVTETVKGAAESARERTSELADRVQERAEAATKQAAEGAEEVSGKLVDVLEDQRTSAGKAAAALSSGVETAADRVGLGRAKKSPAGSFLSQVRKHPIGAAVAVLLLGLLIAKLLRS